MKSKDLPLFKNREARKVLEEACRQQGISLSLLQQLLEASREFAGAGRAIGISERFDTVIADFLETVGDEASAPPAPDVPVGRAAV